MYHLSVPVLRTLFHELTDPRRLRELELADALDLAGAVLNRVDRASFFERFQQEHAVHRNGHDVDRRASLQALGTEIKRGGRPRATVLLR